MFGLRDCMMPGASVMRRMVMIRVSLITPFVAPHFRQLFHPPFVLAWQEEDGVCGEYGIGANILNTVLSEWGLLEYSLVSARRCWCGDISDSWQCCGNSSVKLEMR